MNVKKLATRPTRIVPKRTFVLLIALFIGFTGSISGIEASVEISSLAQGGRVVVNPGEDASGFVQEFRTVPVKTGMNTIKFSWTDIDLDPESITFQITRNLPGTKIDRTILDLDRNTIKWKVYSSEPRSLKTRLSYELNALRAETSYEINIDPDRERLQFSEIYQLTNNSGVDFTNSWIGLGKGNVFKSNWAAGERKKLSVYRVKNVPYDKVIRFDSNDHGEGDDNSIQPLPVFLRFANDSSHNLGDKLLESGEIRLYRNEEQGSIFLGEDQFTTTPIGDSVTIQVGTSRDLDVDRTIRSRNRKNEVRDDNGNVQMYDREQVVQYDVKNFRSDTVSVQLVESIQGEWEMVSHSHDYIKKNNETVLIPVELPPKAKRTVTLEYVQLHRRP